MTRIKGLGRPPEMVTERDAALRNLAPEPPEWRCEHCGKRLPVRGILLGGRVRWISVGECDCAGAEREREESEVKKALEARERRGERLRRSGIGLRYQDAIPTVPECVRFCETFDPHQGTGIYIHGGVGVGKTHNALGIAAALSDRGFIVAAATAVELLSSIRATFDGGLESTSRLKQRFLSCDLMVLDDLGKESATPWSVMTLYEVLNSRYEGMRPTIVTSQYAIDELEARLSRQGESETGRAIASRLRQTSIDIRLDGPDRRNARPATASPRPMREGFEGL